MITTSSQYHQKTWRRWCKQLVVYNAELVKRDAIPLIKLAGGKSMNQNPLKRKEALKQNFKGDESLFE